METADNSKQTAVIGRPFPKGVSGNPDGRPPQTLEQKVIKRATKELIAEYKEGLTEALSKIQPILIAKALQGDVTAIKEIHDRTMDKAKQSTEISGKDGKDLFPLLSEEDRAKLDLIANAK